MFSSSTPESQRNCRSINTVASNGTGNLLTSKQLNWTVFFAVFAASTLASVAFLYGVGFSEDNVRVLLRVTARVAFVILLVIFVARPLQPLFASEFTTRLLRGRRLLGIAFTAVHTAHLGLIFYRVHISDNFVLSYSANTLGALVYLIILAMFATSFNSTARMLGPRNWKILHTFGLYVIFIAFAQREVPRSLETAVEANWILTALALVAVLLRGLPRLNWRGSPRFRA